MQRGVDEAISRNDIELAIDAAHARGVRPQDVWALVCKRDLLPEGFAGQHRRATLASFEEVAQHLAKTCGPQDGLLLVVTNHGDPEGLLVDTPPPDEFAEDAEDPPLLSPALLQQHLDAIPGPQIAVVATCYAGIFLPVASDRRAVLTACGPDEIYYVNRYTQQPPRSPFLYEVLSHWAGVSLADYEAPAPLSMAEAFTATKPACPGCHCEGSARWPE